MWQYTYALIRARSRIAVMWRIVEEPLLDRILLQFTKELVNITSEININTFAVMILHTLFADTGERPYLCSICDKSFARQETANIHKRTHTGEKPHVCKICHRGFTSSGHLTGHMRSHSGTKTHECKVCLKRFAGSSSLKVHMKSHLEKTTQQHHHQIYDNKNTIFECDMCKMNIPSTVLSVPDELQSYNHEFIDDVLICSNVASIIDNGKIIEEIHDANGTNIILTTTNDLENEQQLLINLSN